MMLGNLKTQDGLSIYINFTIAFCPSVSPPKHGRIPIGNRNKQPAGTSITFDCTMSYILTGSTTITCQSDGTWDSSPPTCTAGNITNKCEPLFLYLCDKPILHKTNVLIFQ